MLKCFLLLAAMVFVSCSDGGMPPAELSTTPGKEKAGLQAVTAVKVKADTAQDETGKDFTTEETMNCFVVVADSGNQYRPLQERMFGLHKLLGQEMDTMDRTYNEAKELIALPEDHDDEIYAGDYFPRRYPAASLSIEYLSFYQEGTGKKTMALVAGIYDNKSGADSALRILRGILPAAYIVESRIYMGCIH